MLIPITFKNNDTAGAKTKVGKITPANARLLNSFSLLKKVGIFDGYGGNCTAISTTISAETDNTYTIVLNKGAFSIYGGVGVIEQGTSVNIKNTYTSGSFGIKVNLQQSAGNEVSFYYKPQSEALVKNDLQADEVSGVYEFELYKYTISGSVMRLTDGANLKDYIVGHYENLVNMFDGMTDYVVTFERSGSTWFRKWKSGWKEYGTIVNGVDGVTEHTVTFKENFSDENYSVSAQTILNSTTRFSGSEQLTIAGTLATLPLVFDKQADHLKLQTLSRNYLKYSIVVCGY